MAEGVRLWRAAGRAASRCERGICGGNGNVLARAEVMAMNEWRGADSSNHSASRSDVSGGVDGGDHFTAASFGLAGRDLRADSAMSCSLYVSLIGMVVRADGASLRMRIVSTPRSSQASESDQATSASSLSSLVKS